jgi:hypothetical protein
MYKTQIDYLYDYLIAAATMYIYSKVYWSSFGSILMVIPGTGVYQITQLTINQNNHYTILTQQHPLTNNNKTITL